MRSLPMLVLICAACGGSQKPAALAAESAASEFDPELFEACASDQAYAPRYCDKSEDGTWKTVRPPTNLLLQGRAALEAGQYEAAAYTLTQALLKEDGCGQQYAHEQRAEAYFKLGKYKEAFLDVATIVKDGPENPFYAQAGDWLKTLEPHLPVGALTACWAMYSPELADPKVKDKDEHWKPYTDGDPAP